MHLRGMQRARRRHVLVSVACIAIVGTLAACGGGLGGIEFSPRPQVWLTTGEQGVTISNVGGENVPFSKIYTTNETVFKKVSTTCTSPLKVAGSCKVTINVGSPFKKGETAELVMENSAGEKASDILKTE